MTRKNLPDLFDRIFNWSWDLHNKSLEPLVHIEDMGDHLLVSMDLPYVKKENIEVHLTEDILEVSARMKRKYRFKNLGTIQRGIEFESFRKVIDLPVSVVPEDAKSVFKHGVLEIRLPKKIKKRRIIVE